MWEFRTGNNYYCEEGDETKPVTWLIVAKDHYEGLESHVTLLSEDLIGLHTFDNSTERVIWGAEWGFNHWGESGTTNATRGLRPWLNSSGIHVGEGFFQAFSENFKRAILPTTLPNKEWENGNTYSTQDYVFIPSTTELGDSTHNETYQIGDNYAYLQSADVAKRVAKIGYWTRSPCFAFAGAVLYVCSTGVFHSGQVRYGGRAVRPALNLKAETLVSEIRK